MIKVDTVCMATQAQQMQRIADQLNDIASRVASANRTLCWNTSIDAKVRNTLVACTLTVSRLEDKAVRLGNVLSASATKYEEAEQKAKKGEYSSGLKDIIEEVADRVFDDRDGDGLDIGDIVGNVADIISDYTDGRNPGLDPADILTILGVIGIAGTGSGWSDSDESSGPFTGSWFDYETWDDHPGVTAWVGKVSGREDTENGYAEVNAYLGKVEAGVKADGGFMKTRVKEEYKDGKWETSESMEFLYAEAGVGASVNAVSVDAQIGVGDDMLGLGVESKLDIGNAAAKGEGEFSIGEDGVTAKVSGELMVSAIEGEAKGTVNILGFEITPSVGAYAGAAGVEGKFGFEDGKFVCKGGIAAGLGFSGGIEIGFNEEGWDNAVEFAEKTVDTVVDAVDKGVDAVVDGCEAVLDFVTFWD